jgi:hypothetical protein
MVTGILVCADLPDFAVTGIEAGPQGFIYIKLENRSPKALKPKTESMEKAILTIYINNLKRAEYKLKYLDPQLFRAGGRISLRTNFMAGKELLLKVEFNGQRVIAESDYRNNVLIKGISFKQR